MNIIEKIKKLNPEAVELFIKSKEIIDFESKKRHKDNEPYNSMSTEYINACKDYARSSVLIASEFVKIREELIKK